MRLGSSKLIINGLTQLLVLGVVLTLLMLRSRSFTPEQASLIQIGMKEQQVETSLGRSTPLKGYHIFPWQGDRDNGRYFDDLMFLPNEVGGKGLPTYLLHGHEDYWIDLWGEGIGPVERLRAKFWLGHDSSIVVFFGEDQVTKVVALPTTTKPPNLWDYVKRQWRELVK